MYNIFMREQSTFWNTYIALNLCEYGRPSSVDDRVHLLDDVEVSLVIGVLHPASSPRHVGQLPTG